MWNNVRGNTSWSDLCHARVSEPFELFCTTHRGRKISQYYYAVHKIIRSFRKYTCKHVRATRKRRNLRPFLKRVCVSITLRSWNAAIVSLDPIPFCSHTKHIRNASWGNVDYVLVFTTYSLLCTSCSCLRSSSIDHIWRKMLISAATVCS